MARSPVQRLTHHTLAKYETIWFGLASVMCILLAVAVFASFVSGTIPRLEGEGGAGHHFAGINNGRIDPKNLAGTPFNTPGLTRNKDGSYNAFVLATAKGGFRFVPSVMDVPAHTPINFFITSEDVFHGYYVEKTNINVNVMPGQVASFTTSFKNPGKLSVVCDEYCGLGHHGMINTINVLTPEEFEKKYPN